MNDPNKSKANLNEPEISINTNFIFPAIKVKAFYESTHKKVEDNRLAKKANLYTMIKIESFVMPSFSTNLMSKQITI